MEWSEQPQTLRALAEIFVPLAVGLVQGILVMKFVAPRIRERMGGLMALVQSRTNTVFSLLQMAVLLGVVATCNTVSAPRTLDWLETRDLLPFPQTVGSLRLFAVLAAYLIGTNLVPLLSALSGAPKPTRLEPLPLKNRRPR